MCDLSQHRNLTVIAFVAFGISMAVADCSPVSAHEGPPFPILMDKPLAGYLVSVWADPDIGEATFFVVVESPQGGLPAEAPSVAMWFEPVSGRLDRVACETKQEALRNQLQFIAQPNFDQRDQWTVGFRLTSANGVSEELTSASRVDATWVRPVGLCHLPLSLLVVRGHVGVGDDAPKPHELLRTATLSTRR